MKAYIGREKELMQLKELGNSEQARLVVINGRRRVGKSRLATEAAQKKVLLEFSGLAPIKGMTAQDQRDAFARQLIQYFAIPPFTFTDWSDGFLHLSRHLAEKPTIILFDEISWMGSKDRTFLPKLKAWWDLKLQSHAKVMLILCGSVSTWIEKNIINSTAFFGRIALHIHLEELTLNESYQFLQTKGFKSSVYDYCKILSVTGGIPWYLEQIQSGQTADANIKRLCFEKNGVLVYEFNRIFHDLFDKKDGIYRKLVHLLGTGMRTQAELRVALNYAHSGSLSKYLDNLVVSGFINKHYSWKIKTGKLNRHYLYRLSDNYLRFFIKYIEPNLPKIQEHNFEELSLNNLPGWETMIGFQLENLLLNNRHLLLKMLGISPQEVIADNPYVQKSTARHRGCQVDYLVETYNKNLFICEFKFRRRELNMDIIESMQDKLKRFVSPKGFGICPVLVHLSGVSTAVEESNFFYRCIDFADLLESKT